MAGVDHIADAVGSISLHLEAIRLLSDTLQGVIEDGGTKKHQYEFCLAFVLLAEAAQSKLETVHDSIHRLVPVKALAVQS